MVPRLIRDEHTLVTLGSTRHGPSGRAILSGTAKTLADIMVENVKEGNAVAARMPGYEVGAVASTVRTDAPLQLGGAICAGFLRLTGGVGTYVIVVMVEPVSMNPPADLVPVAADLFRQTGFETAGYLEGKLPNLDRPGQPLRR